MLLHYCRCRDDKLTSGCCRDESKFVSVLITRASLSNNSSSHCFFASHAWPGLSANLLWSNFWAVAKCRLLDCLKRHSRLLEQKKNVNGKLYYTLTWRRVIIIIMYIVHPSKSDAQCIVVYNMHVVCFTMSQINAKSLGKSWTIIICFERIQLKSTTVKKLLWHAIIIIKKVAFCLVPIY